MVLRILGVQLFRGRICYSYAAEAAPQYVKLPTSNRVLDIREMRFKGSEHTGHRLLGLEG